MAFILSTLPYLFTMAVFTISGSASPMKSTFVSLYSQINAIEPLFSSVMPDGSKSLAFFHLSTEYLSIRPAIFCFLTYSLSLIFIDTSRETNSKRVSRPSKGALITSCLVNRKYSRAKFISSVLSSELVGEIKTNCPKPSPNGYGSKLFSI